MHFSWSCTCISFRSFPILTTLTYNCVVSVLYDDFCCWRLFCLLITYLYMKCQNTCSCRWVCFIGCGYLANREPVKRELFANSVDHWLWRQWSRDTWFAEYQWPSSCRDLVNSEPQMANWLHQSHISVNYKSMWERSVFNIMFGYRNSTDRVNVVPHYRHHHQYRFI